MPGPSPKPTALKVIEGTFRADRTPGRIVQPRVEVPSAPRHLSAEARKEWKRIAPELAKLGLVSVIDRAALTAYCDAWSDYVEARGQIAEQGQIQNTPTGYQALSGWAVAAKQAAERMHKFAAEFGMTPAARSRVAASPQLGLFCDEAGSDPAARYF